MECKINNFNDACNTKIKNDNNKNMAIITVLVYIINVQKLCKGKMCKTCFTGTCFQTWQCLMLVIFSWGIVTLTVYNLLLL